MIRPEWRVAFAQLDRQSLCDVLSMMEVALVDRPERLVLSVTEAAEMLGISRSLAYQLVARGELPSRRFGGRVVVLLRPLQRLLDGEPAADATDSPNQADKPSEPAERSLRAL